MLKITLFLIFLTVYFSDDLQTFVDAYHLKNNYFEKRINKKGERKWKIPSFYDLHPEFGRPLHELIEFDFSKSAKEYLEHVLKRLIDRNELKLYTKEEVEKEVELSWIDRTYHGIGYIPSDVQDYDKLLGALSYPPSQGHLV